MGDQTGSMGGGGNWGIMQAPRGWGPPPGAVSGRGGVYLDGQRLSPVPGMSGGWYNPQEAQQGLMVHDPYSPVWEQRGQSKGTPMGGGMGSPMTPPPPTNPYSFPNYANPYAVQGPGGQPGPMAPPTTPYRTPPAPAAPAPTTPRPGGVTQAVQALQRGDQVGAQAYARQGAGLPQMPAGPTLNTTAQVQGAPTQPQGQTLDQWRARYRGPSAYGGGLFGGGPTRPMGR